MRSYHPYTYLVEVREDCLLIYWKEYKPYRSFLEQSVLQRFCDSLFYRQSRVVQIRIPSTVDKKVTSRIILSKWFHYPRKIAASSSKLDSCMSMRFPFSGIPGDRCSFTGPRVSYKLGAWNIIPTVPPVHANVKIQRKNLSNTIATNFQSSITWKRFKKIILKNNIKHFLIIILKNNIKFFLLVIIVIIAFIRPRIPTYFWS